MDEPEIVSFGRTLINKYSAGEFRASLIRAFKDKKADFILLDSNATGQKFLAACVAWAIDKGFIYNDCNQSDEQCKVSSFRLTGAGIKELLG